MRPQHLHPRARLSHVLDAHLRPAPRITTGEIRTQAVAPQPQGWGCTGSLGAAHASGVMC